MNISELRDLLLPGLRNIDKNLWFEIDWQAKPPVLYFRTEKGRRNFLMQRNRNE